VDFLRGFSVVANPPYPSMDIVFGCELISTLLPESGFFVLFEIMLTKCGGFNTFKLSQLVETAMSQAFANIPALSLSAPAALAAK